MGVQQGVTLGAMDPMFWVRSSLFPLGHAKSLVFIGPRSIMIKSFHIQKKVMCIFAKTNLIKVQNKTHCYDEYG